MRRLTLFLKPVAVATQPFAKMATAVRTSALNPGLFLGIQQSLFGNSVVVFGNPGVVSNPAVVWGGLRVWGEGA